MHGMAHTDKLDAFKEIVQLWWKIHQLRQSDPGSKFIDAVWIVHINLRKENCV